MVKVEKIVDTLLQLKKDSNLLYHYYVLQGENVPSPSSYKELPVPENAQLWSSLSIFN